MTQSNAANPIDAPAIQHALRRLGDPTIAAHSQRFFRTGPGDYGAGDRFLGIRIPVLRSLLPRFRHAPLAEILTVLRSPWHEERLFALLLMVHRFARDDQSGQARLFAGYLTHTAFVNNWDLVDSSAYQIAGAFLLDRDRSLLRKLAASPLLWERRIAIVATYQYIKRNSFADCLDIAGLLLRDPHDLIHKAVGWMLREVGKRDLALLEGFLNHNAAIMPRVMLRYALEKFPEARRQHYLAAKNRTQ